MIMQTVENKKATKKITINPITRLEGHGKIEIFLDKNGDVENAYLQIPELRGFEKFSEDRCAEEMPLITPRICGVCPLAHHMASTKALDGVFGVEPTTAAKKLRELMYNAYFFSDHLLHFYYLGGPDFVVGPDAPPADRNIIGVINKVGLEIGSEVIKHRKYGQEILKMMGGKSVHPACGVPGGISKGLTEEERDTIIKYGKSAVSFAQFTIDTFNKIVLGNNNYLDLIKSPAYTMKTYYMGLVDDNNKVNFYDGKIRVVDQDGKEFVKFDPKDYLEHIEEHVEEWTHTKFPFLKKIGWKGLATGKESGIYRVAPLGRLNASDGMNTPLAQKEYEKYFDTLGGKPVHHTLAMHWARIIELLNAAERFLQLAEDKDITSDDIRNNPTKVSGEGVGVVEAARGVLIHHYKTDDKGVMKKANLIVATGNNYPAICISIRDAAKGLIKGGKVTDSLLNMVEMAFRAYDPCMACATHTLPGSMPMEVEIKDIDGKVVDILSRNI
ncbi:MAG: Ni/Fe hydrogenase subunit alpha [Armatimonadota bacterium]